MAIKQSKTYAEDDYYNPSVGTSHAPQTKGDQILWNHFLTTPQKPHV